MASVINQIKVGNVEYAIAHSAYAECSTAAGTQAKAATICADSDTTNTAFTLIKGVSVTVKFTITNTAASPTLNINSTGAKAIYYNGAAITAGYLKAGKTYQFVYDGSYWQLVGDVDTTPTVDAVLSSTSTNPIQNKAVEAQFRWVPTFTFAASQPAGRANKYPKFDMTGALYAIDKIPAADISDLPSAGTVIESHYFEGTIGNWQLYVHVDIYPGNKAHWYGYTVNPSKLTGMQIGTSGIYKYTSTAAPLRLCNPVSAAVGTLGKIDGYVYQPVEVAGVYYPITATALGESGWGTVGDYSGVISTNHTTIYTTTSTINASTKFKFDVSGTYTLMT